GARLSVLTQALAYQGVKRAQKTEERRITHENMNKARVAAATLGTEDPSDKRIWKSLVDNAFSRKVRIFIWKIIHNTYKVGDFWRHIVNLEDRGICPICNVEESLEHILIDCRAAARGQLWNLAKWLWEKKGGEWPALDIGHILACGLAAPTNENNQRQCGGARLFLILVSETAYLIWRLRCERHIKFEDNQAKWHSKAEIHNRWLMMINNRLALDRLMTNRLKYGRRALDPKMVLRTWGGTLKNEANLLGDWIIGPEVLVDISAKRRPRGRNR
ncbi:hypothetical protein FISHEDRAFT_47547, partial [Fistulina hepatica ATCC 64428]